MPYSADDVFVLPDFDTEGLPKAEKVFTKHQLDTFFSDPVWLEISKLLKTRHTIVMSRLLLDDEQSTRSDSKDKGAALELINLLNIRNVLEENQNES